MRIIFSLLLCLFIFNFATAGDSDKKPTLDTEKDQETVKKEDELPPEKNKTVNEDYYNEFDDGFWANLNLNYVFDNNLGLTKSDVVKDQIIKSDFSLQGLIDNSEGGPFNMGIKNFAYSIKLGLAEYEKHKDENFDYQKVNFMSWFLLAGISVEIERVSASSEYDTERVGLLKGTFVGEFGHILLCRYAYSVANGDFAYTENRFTVGVFPRAAEAFGTFVDIGYAARKYKNTEQKNYYGLYVNFGWDSTMYAYKKDYHYKVNLYVGPETDSFDNTGGKQVSSLIGNIDLIKFRHFQPGLTLGVSYEDFNKTSNIEGGSRKDMDYKLGVQTKFIIPFSDQIKLNFCLAYTYEMQKSSFNDFDATKNVFSIGSEFKF